MKNSVFVRSTGLGIRIEAVTGGDDPAAHEVTIVNNLVGLESLTDGAVNGNTLGGIRVVNSARVKVGGPISSQREVISGNVISGNTGNGVEIAGSGTLATVVDGNTIGLNSGGTVQLPNTSNGVLVHLDTDASEISAPAGNTSQLSACRAFGEPENLVFDDGFESSFVDGWSSWSRPEFP